MTCNGTVILKSLNIAHPIGKLLVDAAITSSQITGDGSKAVVLIVAEFLKLLESHVPGLYDITNDLHLAKRADVLMALRQIHHELFSERMLLFLMSHSKITCFRDGEESVFEQEMSKIVTTSIGGQLNRRNMRYIVDLVCKWLIGCTEGTSCHGLTSALRVCKDNIGGVIVEVSGQSMTTSRVIKGVLLQTDPIITHPKLYTSSPVRFSLVAFSFTGENLPQADLPVLAVHTSQQIERFLVTSQSRVSTFLDSLISLGVHLVLFRSKVSEQIKMLCKQRNITLCHVVCEEDMDRLARLTGCDVIHATNDVTNSCVAVVKNCRLVALGGKQYLNFTGLPQGHKDDCLLPNQLVLCAPSSGAARQLSLVVSAALRSVICWLDINHVMRLSGHNLHDDVTESNDNIPASSAFQERFTLCELSCNHDNAMRARGVKHFMEPQPHIYGVAIVAGGGFELAISHFLSNFGQERVSRNHTISLLCRLLGRACMIIPTILAAQSYAPPGERLCGLELTRQSECCLRADRLNGVHPASGDVTLTSHQAVEPVPGKLAALKQIMCVLEQIVRLTDIVSVTKLPSNADTSDNEEDSDIP